jgi:arylsulfatase A-like enzyme
LILATTIEPMKTAQTTQVRPEPVFQPVPLFHLAVGFGLLTGLADGIAWLIQDRLLRHRTDLGTETLWMAPLADLVVFGLVGGALSALRRYRPGLVTLARAVAVFAFLAYASVLLSIKRLHPGASLLLAAGLGIQTGRWAGRHSGSFLVVFRATLGWTWLSAIGSQLSAIVHRLFAGGRGPISDQPPMANQPPAPLLDRRHVLLSAGATVAGIGLGVHGWRALVEQRTSAGLPAPPEGAPNVLLIVLDTVRAQSLGLYGYKRPTTPRLERLAANGVVFQRAISTASWTLPSHATMFTGRYLHELSTTYERALDATYPTLAEAFRDSGYATAGFVANVSYCARHFGLARGFTHYEDFPISAGQVVLSGTLTRKLADWYAVRRLTRFYDYWNRQPAELINEHFLDWLSRRAGRPFFAFLNYFDAHTPYLPPRPFETMFGPRRLHDYQRHVRQRQFDCDWLDRHKLSPAERQSENDAYDGAIAYMDQQLGLLLAELEKRGELNNTLVVITADHGEHFGEHGLYFHGNSLYLPLLHVPLVVLFPGKLPAGVRVDRAISLRDLAATVVDVAGLHTEVSFPGNSLARLWNGPSPTVSGLVEPLLSEHEGGWLRELWYPSAHGSMRSLLRGRFHYINYADGTEELYDFESDPRESSDLVKARKGRQHVVQFRAELRAMLGPSRA